MPREARSCSANEVAPLSTRSPRRRREPERRSSNVRTVLLGIVVIVAGLAIGMLSAVVMHRGGNSELRVPAAPRVTPLAVPAPAESAQEIGTPQPLTTEKPVVVETPLATPSALRTPAPTPGAARATVAPTPGTTVGPAVTSRPIGQASALPSATPSQAATPLSTRSAAASPSAPAPTPAALATGFDLDIAQAVVRRYLDAILRGDSATARALLGASPTDATVPLPELAFVNTTSKIGTLAARRTGDSSAAVQVQIVDGSRKYEIVYEVVQRSAGIVISGRDITRP